MTGSKRFTRILVAGALAFCGAALWGTRSMSFRALPEEALRGVHGGAGGRGCWVAGSSLCALYVGCQGSACDNGVCPDQGNSEKMANPPQSWNQAKGLQANGSCGTITWENIACYETQTCGGCVVNKAGNPVCDVAQGQTGWGGYHSPTTPDNTVCPGGC